MARILDYGSSTRRGISRRMGWGLVLAALLAVTIWQAAVWVPRWRAILLQRRILREAIAAQKACMEFSLPADRIVFTDDPADVAELGADKSTYAPLAGHAPSVSRGRDRLWQGGVGLRCEEWPAYHDLAGRAWGHWFNWGPDGMAFMHARRNPNGQERLVVVHVGGAGYLSWIVLTPGDQGNPPSGFTPGFGVALNRRYQWPLRIFAGQPDPRDLSHFTLDYLYHGQRGRIDAYLNDDDSITFGSTTAWVPQTALSGRARGDGIEVYLDAAIPISRPPAATQRIDLSNLPRVPRATAALSALAFSSDGKTLAVGSSGLAEIVHFVDVGTGRVVGSIPGDDQEVTSLAYSPDGSVLAIGTPQHMYLWETAGKRIRLTVPARATVGDAVTQLLFLPDSKRLIVVHGSWPEMVGVADGKEIQGVARPLVRHLALDPTGQTVASAERGRIPVGSPITLFTLSGNREQREPKFDTVDSILASEPAGADFPGLWLAWSPDGKVLLMAFGAIRAVDPATGQELWQRQVGDQYDCKPVFSPDGRSIAVPGGGSVRVLDSPAARTILTLPCNPMALTRPVAWSPDSRWLAALTADLTISLWDLGQAPATLP